MFSQEEYHSRRSKLIKKCGKGIIILPSYSTKTMSNDVNYEFRQQSDLWYFTGFPEPNSAAVIEVTNDEEKFSMFVPKRDKEFEIWNGRRYGTEGAKSEFGTDEAYTIDEFEEKIAEMLKKHETVFYPMGENDKIDAIINDKMLKATKAKNKVGKGPINLTNSLYVMHQIRAIKTEPELEIIRRSAEISAKAMTLGIEVTKPGMTEQQIEAVIEYYYAKNGSDRPAYPSIVGTGINATILHYIENTAELKDGDLLLVDAGAEYHGYASDITRTWPVNGEFSPPQRKLYQLVLDVQEACIAKIKPGTCIQELQDHAVKMLTQGFVDLGLLEGEVDELIEEEEYKRYFMHGIGHYLGMDVHDTTLLGKEYTLQENHYFTVEPGVYIPDEDDIPEEFRGIGIRIEDDILVTADGCENLTDGVVKSIDEIEKLVGTSELP